MRRDVRALLVCAVLAAGWPAGIFAQTLPITKLTRTPVGTPIIVTPGQEFYAQVEAAPTPALRLPGPFKSSMPGTMGMAFGFAIDTDTLVLVHRDADGYGYFIPPDHKYRAWHSLLGSVLRGRDTVGLRIGPAGQREWFVDNSTYARRPTLWTRPIRPTDPALTLVKVDLIAQPAVERLIFLGLSSTHRVKIRYQTIAPRKTTDQEFTFPLDKDGRGIGAVNGARFTLEVTPTQAVITVVSAMTSDVGEPVAPPPEPGIRAATPAIRLPNAT